MIEVAAVSASPGRARSAREMSFRVRPGIVAGLMGPGGSGKTTTLRLVVGLERPARGEVRIAGRRWSGGEVPATVLGTDLHGVAMHPERTVGEHLTAHAEAGGLPRQRVAAALDLARLTADADRRPGDLSRAQTYRAVVATALLADPLALVLDEPVGGDDPMETDWLTELTSTLAASGRAVLVSSPYMSLIEQVADQIIVIDGGTIVSDALLVDYGRPAEDAPVRVRSTDDAQLEQILHSAGVPVQGGDGVSFSGIPVESVAVLAASAGIALTRVMRPRPSLAQVCLSLIDGRA